MRENEKRIKKQKLKEERPAFENDVEGEQQQQ